MTPRPCAILHVDSDAETRMLVQMSLCLDGDITVRGAASAEEACKRLEQASGASGIDGIILASQIGDATGIELLQRIRAIGPAERIPVLFLTGRLMARDTSAMIAAGAAGILPKPFNPLTLAAEVRRLIDR